MVLGYTKNKLFTNFFPRNLLLFSHFQTFWLNIALGGGTIYGNTGPGKKTTGRRLFCRCKQRGEDFFHLLKQRGEDFSEILKERGEKVFQISFEKFENFLNFCQNIKIGDIGSTYSVRKLENGMKPVVYHKDRILSSF